MNLCLFCSCRDSSLNAIKYLNNIANVVMCVFEEKVPNEIQKFCEDKSIPYTNYINVDKMISNSKMPNCDYGIAFLYHKIIKKNVIDYFDGRLINFHPSLVQEHKGIASFCYCLLNDYNEWGVTAHFITEGVDDGDIILQRKFVIPDNCNAMQLENLQQKELLCLLKDVMSLCFSGKDIPRTEQDLSSRIYYGQKDLDNDKNITVNDSHEIIDKKIKALWYPPYHGACITIDGKRYSLVNDELLNEIAKLYSSED